MFAMINKTLVWIAFFVLFLADKHFRDKCFRRGPILSIVMIYAYFSRVPMDKGFILTNGMYRYWKSCWPVIDSLNDIRQKCHPIFIDSCTLHQFMFTLNFSNLWKSSASLFDIVSDISIGSENAIHFSSDKRVRWD